MLETLPPLRTALLTAIPLLFLLAAFIPGLPIRATPAHWRWARLSALLALGCAVLSVGWLALSGPGLARGPELLSLGEFGSLHPGVRSDALGCIVLLLVTFIGWVIVGFSSRYMGGDAGQPRYLRYLMLTLSAVSLLVIANNLLVLAFAWIGTSLALHGLLTHFSDRVPAMVAAHKKFLASRLSDLALIAAIVLVGSALGSFELDRVVQQASALPELPGALQAAAILFVISALLKCAQLPVHGWLIQVMEAPTPVSALLHAGVVNLGGFLLIRLSGLVGASTTAQTLLIVVASLTAALAALVMMTRISIKVSLAWSTCAQMGFMLMQCGLGAYELALLHLVAHSLYKAHAFLGAGGAVEQARLTQMTAPAPVVSATRWLVSALIGLLAVGCAAWALGIDAASSPELLVLGAVLALALAPLLAGQALRDGGPWPLLLLLGAFGVAFLWFGLHLLSDYWLGMPEGRHGASAVQLAWVLGVFVLLFAVQGIVRIRPQGALARRLYPLFFAGLHLDELFTRFTFRLWPVRMPVNDPEADAAFRERLAVEVTR